jgi:hypothetical protein
VAGYLVPQADNHDLGNRTFVAAAGEAKAAAQIAVWSSLTQPASVQRWQTFEDAVYRVIA